jgi:hypothetical protein
MRRFLSQYIDWIEIMVENQFRLSQERHALLFPLVKWFLIFFLPVAWLSLFVSIISPLVLIVKNQTELPILASLGKIFNPETQNQSSSFIAPVSKPCIFSEKEWEKGQGSLIKDKDQPIFILATTSKNGLLRFSRSIPPNSKVVFNFVPLGEEFINTVMHFHNLYEVIIGDGSYNTITVKASRGEGQQMDFIRNNEGELRVFVPGGFKIGNDISIQIIQKPISTDEYEVFLTIYYYSSSSKLSQRQVLNRQYYFSIPPQFKFEDEPLRVSIGMVNAESNSIIKSKFLCFEVSEA